MSLLAQPGCQQHDIATSWRLPGTPPTQPPVASLHDRRTSITMTRHLGCVSGRIASAITSRSTPSSDGDAAEPRPRRQFDQVVEARPLGLSAGDPDHVSRRRRVMRRLRAGWSPWSRRCSGRRPDLGDGLDAVVPEPEPLQPLLPPPVAERRTTARAQQQRARSRRCAARTGRRRTPWRSRWPSRVVARMNARSTSTSSTTPSMDGPGMPEGEADGAGAFDDLRILDHDARSPRSATL